MIKLMDLMADPEYADREIMYVVYLRVLTGVMGYECKLKIKNCDRCPLIRSCYPIMLDPPIDEPEIETLKSTKESTKTKQSPKE